MNAASLPIQRSSQSKLLYVSATGRIEHAPRSSLINFLRAGDLVVGNDAATLPASLHGTHARTNEAIEVRLAGRSSLAPEDMHRFIAVVFGHGDYRTRTENRPLPPALVPGDVLDLGPLTAVVEQLLQHPRLISLRFEGSAQEVWAGLASHARPIQYAHLSTTLRLWDVWTPIAGAPAAYEPPSAGFALDWQLLAQMKAKGVGFVTITHAAGISSTGDAELDKRLPLDEPYRISFPSAHAIGRTRRAGGRIVAVGTTVVRALEHAAARDGEVHAGEGLATQRIGAESRLRVVDAILSGTHEAGSSHYELLRAFASDEVLERVKVEQEELGYLTHEFGDSVLVERASVHSL